MRPVAAEWAAAMPEQEASDDQKTWRLNPQRFPSGAIGVWPAARSIPTHEPALLPNVDGFVASRNEKKMDFLNDDNKASAQRPAETLTFIPTGIPPELRGFLDGNPQGLVVIVYMKPERVHGIGDTVPEEAKAAKPAVKPTVMPQEGKRLVYRAGNWYFASDLVDRFTEVATCECSGFKVRPALIEVTYELDAKAFRNLDQIAASFDNAYRGL